MTLSPSLSLRKKDTPSVALLRSLPPPKTTLGEFAIPCHPHRAKPRQEWLVVAPGPPHRSRGHGIATRCIAPLPSPAEAVVCHPRLDQRPRLDRRNPFIFIKSEPQIKESMTESDTLRRGLVSHHGPGPWDSGPIPRDF
jgi:hypothetical protein